MEAPVDTPVSSALSTRTVASLSGPTASPLVGDLAQVDPERMHATLESLGRQIRSVLPLPDGPC
jgi:hypothetical protein